jgi:hypothetical protein
MIHLLSISDELRGIPMFRMMMMTEVKSAVWNSLMQQR